LYVRYRPRTCQAAYFLKEEVVSLHIFAHAIRHLLAGYQSDWANDLMGIT